MVRIRITKSVEIPNPIHLARCLRAPELGPRVLFFSGGTALRPLSRKLVNFTHNSIHLITPFDSGGSSAHLRKAFRMLAVGDLRNRLMALADHSIKGQPEVFALFAYRFPKTSTQHTLRRRLARMVGGRDPMVSAIREPMRRLIRNHLGYFHEHLDERFDLRGANIGNLILAGGYLNNRRHIDPVIYLFSKLVQVRGVVRPISSAHLHLVARLANGKRVVGQHRITGRETPPIESPVTEVFLSRRQRNPDTFLLEIKEKIRKLILKADLICYPMGSFYTSLIANLLPHGVGQAVAETQVPKVYVPNTGFDPEEFGLDLRQKVEKIVAYLKKGCHHPTETARLLHYVLIDSAAQSPHYTRREIAATQNLGVRVIELPLSTPQTAPLLDANKVAEALISLT